MLKRFMNWLLYRLQKALGAISGHRKGTRSGTAFQVNSSAEGYQEGYQLEGGHSRGSLQNSQSENVSSESGAYPQSSSISGSGDSESSPFIDAAQVPLSSNTVNTPVNPAVAEPDTHRRLNASAAALPGIETAVPSFPTEVSELVSSSPAATDLSVSHEQLPEIHDLLPAVETEHSTDEPSDDSGATSSEDAANAFDVSQPEVSLDTSDDLSSNHLLSNDSEEEDSEDVDALPPQAVLFSFDIIESNDIDEEASKSPEPEIESILGQDNAQTVPVSEAPQILSSVENSSVETPINDECLNEPSEPSVVSDSVVSGTDDATTDESLVIATGHVEAGEPMTREGVHEPFAAELHEAKSSALAIDAERTLDVLSDDVSLEPTQPEGDTAKETVVAPCEIEPLPYPWSLAVPKQIHTATADTLEKTDAVSSLESTATDSATTRGDESLAQEGRTLAGSGAPVALSPESNLPDVIAKTGVVKLLFTLKPGNYHGYIVPDDGTQDILFHQKYINSDVFERLDRGAQVMVRVKHIEGKAYATHVELQ